MPGCIQAHGVLLVLRLADLTILQASENSEQHLGVPVPLLLGQSVTQVIGVANAESLKVVLQGKAIEGNPIYLFTLPARAGAPAFDVCAHTIEGVLVVEFEPTGRNKNHGDGDYFLHAKTAINRLQAVRGLREFCQRVSEELRSLSGLDRVMVYRFHADNHGEVFAESKREDLAPLLGLHYPESDIPQPARDIYKRIWIRPLPDAAGALAELQPLANPDTGRPLNMTYCALRGASVMYTEYLANMGVAASLTLAILIDGELWGLIAGHHLTPTYFSYQLRAACELLAQVVSLQLKAVEQNEQLAYRLKIENIHQQLIAKAAEEGNLMALSDRQPSLLDALDADGVALYHLNRWWCVGTTPTEPQLDALAEWLLQRPQFDSDIRPVFTTETLAKEYPAAKAFATIASGILALQLSRLRENLIIWFRPETIQTVKWAGNPQDKPRVPGPNGLRLTPRTSFELYVESVRERSLPWTTMEINSALQLRLLIMELVIARAKRLMALNSDLNNSKEELDAFAYVAAYDLKEPLYNIRRYAYQLQEGEQALDADNQQRVENLIRVSLRMDNLLDSLVHFSRIGRTHLDFVSVDLNEILGEALEMIGARQKGKLYSLVTTRPLPTVKCDPIRVREILSNLVSNALKFNHNVCPRIEVGYITPNENGAPDNTPAEANGLYIYYVRDDGIGIEQRYFEQIFRMFKRLHGREEFGGGFGAGLAVVKKVLKRHAGCIWLESTIGVGSCFYFTLPSGEEA